jgi:hypothetical protein
MSKTPLVLIAGLLAATFACAPAFAQTGPLASASCKDARLDQVIDGNVVSSEPVVVCKHAKAKLHPMVKTETPEPARVVQRVAFNAGPDRECAMLTCPTFILTGVGD